VISKKKLRWTQEQTFAHIFLERSNYYYDLEKTKMNHQIKFKKANAEAVKNSGPAEQEP
jgi:hypothetical protein